MEMKGPQERSLAEVLRPDLHISPAGLVGGVICISPLVATGELICISPLLSMGIAENKLSLLLLQVGGVSKDGQLALFEIFKLLET